MAKHEQARPRQRARSADAEEKAASSVGPRIKQFHMHHLDGSKTNNRVDNLIWVSDRPAGAKSST